MATAKPLYKTLRTDVLVIGAGGAGLRAAIEANNKGAKVLIVTKEYMGGAHTSMAMGGLNVAIKKPATPKQHFEDTVNGGWHINNYKMAKIFTREMPQRIYDLESYGVKFDRLPDGSFYTWAGGKQSAPLNLCAGDYTGREIVDGLVREIKKLKIPYLDDYFVIKLFTKKQRVIGALLMDLKKGTYTVVSAKATIIATGGGGMMYLFNTNAESNTGEGYAWALDLGAELVDMEMVQFHPTGMAYPDKVRGRLITEKVRGHGGKLINSKGERFMSRYQPKRMELAGRDEVARAIYQEVKEGRGTKHHAVYLNVTHWPKGQAEKIIPEVFEDHEQVGIDIRKQMMEVYPSMHHMMGGINITEWGQTTIPGLFAAGEVTRNIHGANRLGGNSVAEGQVFGRRVGIKATEYALSQSDSSSPSNSPASSEIEAEIQYLDDLQHRKKGKSVKEVFHALQVVMWDYVGLIRDEKKLEHAQKEIKKLQKDAKLVVAQNKKELQMALELMEMLKVAQTIVVAAILRKESRGAHYRTDYPEMDPKWEKNIVVYKDKNGALKTKTAQVVK